MKTLLLVSLVTLLGNLAFASGDEETVLFDCTRAVMIPDLGLQVQVLEGGLAGVTSIRVDHFYMSGSNVENFIVQQRPIPPKIVGAPEIYESSDVRFTINLTVAPRPDGKHVATLETKQNGKEELLCK